MVKIIWPPLKRDAQQLAFLVLDHTEEVRSSIQKLKVGALIWHADFNRQIGPNQERAPGAQSVCADLAHWNSDLDWSRKSESKESLSLSLGLYEKSFHEEKMRISFEKLRPNAKPAAHRTWGESEGLKRKWIEWKLRPNEIIFFISKIGSSFLHN